MFYEGLRFWWGSGSNEAVIPGGSAKERPSRAWGEREGGEARFVVFYEGLRLRGCSVSNQPMGEGGSAKERPSRAWGEGEGGAGII